MKQLIYERNPSASSAQPTYHTAVGDLEDVEVDFLDEGAPVDLTNAATISFRLQNCETGEYLARAVDLSEVQSPATAGKIHLPCDVQDTGAGGEFWSEFVITFTDGNELTLPGKRWNLWSIQGRLSGPTAVGVVIGWPYVEVRLATTTIDLNLPNKEAAFVVPTGKVCYITKAIVELDPTSAGPWTEQPIGGGFTIDFPRGVFNWTNFPELDEVGLPKFATMFPQNGAWVGQPGQTFRWLKDIHVEDVKLRCYLFGFFRPAD